MRSTGIDMPLYFFDFRVVFAKNRYPLFRTTL